MNKTSSLDHRSAPAQDVVDLLSIARLVCFRQADGIAGVSDEIEYVSGDDVRQGVLCFAGPGSWANQAINFGLIGPVHGKTLDRVIEFYESRQTEPRIEVCPYSDESLLRGLGERGFRVREVETTLVIDLENTPIPALPTDIEVVRIDPGDAGHMAESISIRRECFVPSEPAEAHDRMMQKVLNARGVYGFMTRVDGAFVAAGDVEAIAPCAVLIAGATRPAARNRGCQRALMIARLHAAREAGCRYVMVESKPHVATGRNALRLGFFVAYTKLTFVRPGDGLRPSP